MDAAINDKDIDMDAALLQIHNFVRNGIQSSATDTTRVWTTQNPCTTSRGNKLLVSKLNTARVLLMETNDFFQSNSPQTDDKTYISSSMWIVENYQRIKKQVQIIQKYLGENSTLPDYKSLPRVYAIAQEIVSGTNGNFDIEFLTNCLQQFQTKINLNVEELWTIPVMLKLVIIERIGLISTTVVMSSIFSRNVELIPPRNQAEFLKIVGNVHLSKLDTEFLHKIDRNSRNFSLNFILQRLDGCHRNETICHSDLDISSSIKTLSLLSSLDWEQIGFVESLSIIDQTFEKGVVGQSFQLLDRLTKTRFRQVVRQIEQRSLLSEEEVAKLAVRLARNYIDMNINPGDPHKSDIGYYLIDNGLPVLRKMAKMKLSAGQAFQQYFFPSISVFHYVGSILVLSVALSCVVFNSLSFKMTSKLLLLTAVVCTFLVSTQWANEIINYIAAKLITPNLLPRFDFDKTGIPTRFRTIVAIPSLISNLASVNSLISQLEIRFLGNQDENLDFALLTDFEDANQEILHGDQPLLDCLKSKILRLNANYSKTRNNGRSIFYALHRPRVFNSVDKNWMGYERKRGKLAAFNNLLRGIDTEKFNFIVGDFSQLKGIKYVITLDTDTSLPRDSARKLVGTMAHPLNRPVLNHSHQLVVRGYGILQPRISLNLPVANSSSFSKLFSSSYVGLDPYSRAVSNVNQDLFGESSYIGKGIYDVDIFQTVLAGRFPENRILSHDLLEGNFLRTGFVADIQLHEDFPQTYVSDLLRRHRWIRGDWQNVQYIVDGNFSALSRWKIFDNLRRSLVPVAEFLLFLICWQTLPILFFCSMRILFSLSVQDLISIFKFNRKLKFYFKLPVKIDVTQSLIGIWDSVLLFFFEISCLPNEAYHSLDAIVRTITRLIVTKNNLLEWTASDSLRMDSNLKFRNFVRKMCSGPLVFLSIMTFQRTDILLLPILFCWGISPLFAWSLSQSTIIKPKSSVLSSKDVSFLRRIARKTWAYFEQFNVAEENHLPPDNYRESPNELIAHRTSPTNIGLAVLSNLTAYDFGYLSCTEMVERISNTLDTLGKLEKHRGHLYNWYDTRSTKTLLPKYVSTVDSGNLAGSLLVLRQGLLTLPSENIISNQMFEGLLDTLRLAFDELEPLFSEETMKLQSLLVTAIDKPNSLVEVYQHLQNMQMIRSTISEHFVMSSNQTSFVWFKKFDKQLVAALNDLLKFAPWLKLDKIPEEFECFGNILNRLMTLRGLAGYPCTLQIEFEKLTGLCSSSLTERKVWLDHLKDSLNIASRNALQMINTLEGLAQTCEHLVNQMDYDFLYDPQRRLLRIGCNVEKNLPDDCCYDLLASEARLGIFVAISLGKISQESWFQLGRKLTKNSRVLQSWTGSMFEYLMPQLVMPTFEDTQLSRTFKEIVKIQINYGRVNDIPWGISESSCATWVESLQDYFYRPAGIKELSLDPKLEQTFIIAPYATMLALMVDPKEACLNLKEMSRHELEGVYGFYEAGDFTPNTLSGDRDIVRAFMAHHQAMSFLALENLLLNEPMQRRFECDPNFQSSMILLK